MKIAYITVAFPYGPHEAFFASEVRELAALHHDVTVIPARPVRGPIPHRAFAAGVLRLPPFGLQTLARAAATFARQPRRTLRALGGLLSARHGAGAKLKNLAIFPKALAVAWEARRREIDHVHALWLSTPATIAYVVSELTGIPWSASAHRFDVFADNLLRDKLESASFVRAISENTRRLLLERAGDDLSDRCKVVHLGVDVPAALAMRRKDRTVRLLCPAQLVAKKGHAYLLDALALLRDTRIPFACDLAGDGPLGADLKRKIDDLGLAASVSLCGNMPHDILLSRLERSFYDVVVLASVDIDGQPGEGIPVSLMEAMAVGVPCVATRTGGVPELIDDPRCSRIVPQRDPSALAAAIVEFALDPARRAAIGERARQRIRAAFDVKTTTLELCKMMGTP